VSVCHVLAGIICNTDVLHNTFRYKCPKKKGSCKQIERGGVRAAMELGPCRDSMAPTYKLKVYYWRLVMIFTKCCCRSDPADKPVCFCNVCRFPLWELPELEGGAKYVCMFFFQDGFNLKHRCHCRCFHSFLRIAL
jgi:hypothetical protein